MLLVAIETKDIIINCTYTNKVITVSLIKSIPSDTFKAHMLSLEIRQVQYLGYILLCRGLISFVKTIYVNVGVPFS